MTASPKLNAAAPQTSPVATLALAKVSRLFGPVQVLFDVDFDLFPGEVHALIGENGAGKSTMMKIMSGYLAPSRGSVLLDGEARHFASSQEAEDAGVILIHQEFNLAEELTVEQNIFLGRELRRGFWLDHAAMRAKTQALLDELECKVDPGAKVCDISVSDKQMVEIAKALSRNARVLIMDEPTAVLTNREAAVLFKQVSKLKARGTAILYTSHKLEEVSQLADRITVLRDGRKVITQPAEQLSEDAMAQHMVGRELSNLFPPKPADCAGEIVLEAKNLTVAGGVTGASFTLRRGEVLGFSGLVGSGRTELMEGLVGLRSVQGEIAVNGESVKINSVQGAARAGIAYLTEDRKGRGLLLRQTMRPNLTLFSLARFTKILVDGKAENKALDRAIEEFDIRAPTRQVQVGNLSGGNQQKLLLAKIMLNLPEIVIIDEPTRGIDIGTKQQIYQFIRTLADEGKSVIVISSEMAEVIGLASRVYVMRAGRVTGEVVGEDINEDVIVRYAMGLEGGKYQNNDE